MLNPDAKSVICLVGGMLKLSTLTLKVVPNVAKCLDPTFPFWVWCSWFGYAEMTHPNPRSCSKCLKMPRSNFEFLGVTFLVWGMLKIIHSSPRSCPKCYKMHRSSFSVLGATFLVGGMLKIPTHNSNITVTWKSKIQIFKCSLELKFTSFLFRHKISWWKGEGRL